MKKILAFCFLLLFAPLAFSQAPDNGPRTVVASGTNTYTITSPSPAVYTVGESWKVKFTNANTGAATLNRSGLGAKAIVKNGSSPLVAGDIASGQMCMLVYDGSNFQLVGGSSVVSSNVQPSTIFSYGKTITWFGDSYTTGFGPSNVNNRFSTLVCGFLGATENNQGVSGTTLEKQTPINWSGSTPNMVDNIGAIPNKSETQSLLVFAYGLNDVGYAGGNYNATNFKSDYYTVINAAMAKGWPSNQILMLSPFYITTTGYANYTSQNGTTPDATRHLQFVAATKDVADKYGCLYLDIYSAQVANSTTLLIADGIHASDAGHVFIANQILKKVYGSQTLPFSHNDATSSAGNRTYLANFQDYSIFAINRSSTGVFANTAKAAAQYSLYGSIGDGHHEWYTSSTNNTTPTLTMKLDKNGVLNLLPTSLSQLIFGSGGSLVSLAANASAINGGSYYDGANWKALGTTSSIITLANNQGAVSGFSFYINSGLTPSNSFTPTEVGRWNAGGIYFGSGTPTAKVHISAGAAAANSAPLKFTSGTNLTTAEAGAVEFDGTVFYGTAAASSRQVIDAEQFISLTATYTLTSQTALQKLFNSSTNGALTVQGSKSYFFECEFDLSSLSASSGDFSFGFGGTATFTSLKYTSDASKAAVGTPSTSQMVTSTVATATSLVTANTTTTGHAYITGIVRINAGGTLIPQIGLGVATAAVVGVNSWFRITPIGTNTVTNVGNWN